MPIQLSASQMRFSLRAATFTVLLSVLALRTDGTTRLTAILYFSALVAYLFVKWRIAPWKSLPEAEPSLERGKALALNSTHFVILGMLLGALIVIITANELRRFAPEFTVERVAEGYKSGAYPEPLFTLDMPQQYKRPGELIVIGRVEQQVVLLELRKVIFDVAREGLDRLASITLALFLLPCIGIFALKLLEAVALL